MILAARLNLSAVLNNCIDVWPVHCRMFFNPELLLRPRIFPLDSTPNYQLQDSILVISHYMSRAYPIEEVYFDCTIIENVLGDFI